MYAYDCAYTISDYLLIFSIYHMHHLRDDFLGSWLVKNLLNEAVLSVLNYLVSSGLAIFCHRMDEQ